MTNARAKTSSMTHAAILGGACFEGGAVLAGGLLWLLLLRLLLLLLELHAAHATQPPSSHCSATATVAHHSAHWPMPQLVAPLEDAAEPAAPAAPAATAAPAAPAVPLAVPLAVLAPWGAPAPCPSPAPLLRFARPACFPAAGMAAAAAAEAAAGVAAAEAVEAGAVEWAAEVALCLPTLLGGTLGLAAAGWAELAVDGAETAPRAGADDDDAMLQAGQEAHLHQRPQSEGLQNGAQPLTLASPARLGVHAAPPAVEPPTLDAPLWPVASASGLAALAWALLASVGLVAGWLPFSFAPSAALFLLLPPV